MLKRIGISVTFILFLITVMSGLEQIRYTQTSRLAIDTPQVFEVKSGSGIGRVCEAWKKHQWVSSCWQFKVYFKLFPLPSGIKKGVYELSNMTVLEAYAKIARGAQKQFSFTIVEGETFKQVLNKMQHSPYLVFDPNKMHAEPSPEGWLMPETYHYIAYSTASELFDRAKQSMETTLDSLWQSRTEGLPLASKYDALILASIIEKETAVNEERQMVASVFINRLKIGMRLQTDPTVIYGLGERFAGDITRAHLNEMTPYNTYRINGLPPTPIAMPSKASIYAALQPATSSYYYFVADGSGGHVFSKTLKEHNQAVRRYLEKSKNAG
ncbi:FIG004453: protein YceG like [Pseudoalteromonas luteoviolacea B = ATCC 29581]|nr:FIG004453: protein YceG like [Pseudoalteromonas luteoviolacea B = ATCC 29581]